MTLVVETIRLVLGSQQAATSQQEAAPVYQSQQPEFDDWGFPARAWDEAMHRENPCVSCPHSEAWHLAALAEIQSGPTHRAAAAEAKFLSIHRDITNE